METQSRPPAPPSPPSRPPPPNSSIRQQRSKVIDELLSTEKDFHHQMELCCTKVIPALKEVYGEENLPQLELEKSEGLAVPGPGFLYCLHKGSLDGGCSSLISALSAQTKSCSPVTASSSLSSLCFITCLVICSPLLSLPPPSPPPPPPSPPLPPPPHPLFFTFFLLPSFAPSSLPPLPPSLPLFFTFSLLL